MMKNYCGIYMVSRINKAEEANEVYNHEVYIGCSSNIKKRWSSHMANMKKGRFAYESFNEGWKNDEIKFEILEQCTVDELQEREQYYMDYMRKVGFTVVNQHKAGKLPLNSQAAKKNKSNRQSGSGNGNAKLTEEQVKQLRKEYAEGVPAKELHIKYGICVGYVHCVAHGGTWTKC